MSKQLVIILALLTILVAVGCQPNQLFDDYSYDVTTGQGFLDALADIEVLLASYRNQNLTAIEIKFYYQGSPVIGKRALEAAQDCILCGVTTNPPKQQEYCKTCPAGKVLRCAGPPRVGGGASCI